MKKIIKILKFIDSQYTSENGEINIEIIEEIEQEAYTFEQFYNFVDDIGLTNNQDETDKLIALFCVNWKLCNGEWDKFLNGELQLKSVNERKFKVKHDYMASVRIVEEGEVVSYLPSIALLTGKNHEIDYMEETTFDHIDFWDSEWEVEEL